MQANVSNIPSAAVITGAGRGIGRAIALEMASMGTHVVCISQSNSAVKTAETIRERGGSSESLALDLRDYQNTERVISAWAKGASFRDVVSILAAATLGPTGSLTTTPLEFWEETFSVNVLGNLAVARAVLSLQERNGYGRILFFAGGGAAYAYPIFPAYAASKTALVRIVENLAEDLKGKGDFAVAILAPGAVDTDTLASVRAQGGYIKTIVDIQEPTRFAVEFACSTSCNFTGCFVHVRDIWSEYLNSSIELPKKDLWKLRRIE